MTRASSRCCSLLGILPPPPDCAARRERVKAFRRSSPYRTGDKLTIHTKGGQSVQGAFLRRTRREWVLTKHSIEMDGVYVESSYDRLCVPVECVALVEVRER